MNTKTRSGVPLQRSYTAPNGEGERPGEFPFTRGRLSNLHSQPTWIQRELSGEGDGRRSNEQIRYLLAHGQTGIDVIGDAPTQSLLDPDHPLAREAVGTQGVSLCRKQDFLDLLNDVPFDRVSISSSAPSFFALSGLVLAAREARFPLDRLRGSILHGPLYTEDCSYAWHLPWNFVCVWRSTRLNIVRSTCLSFMPISKTRIFSANPVLRRPKKWHWVLSS
jgi:methylmalonyl-CoA mutase N-terminal domain/subunit